MASATLNPSLDTDINADSPTATNASDTDVIIGENNAAAQKKRTLMKFDLSTLPAASIVTSATLRLYCNLDRSSNARDFKVFRQKRAWTASATWNKYDGSNDWATAGGFGSDDCEQTDIGTRSMTATEDVDEYKEWTLTASAITAMINGTFTNNGFLIKADTETDDAYRFNSVDAAGNKPQLVLEYRVGVLFYQKVVGL